MSVLSDRLGLPLLSAGQAQKEIYHNEALTSLDFLVQGSVEDQGVDDPPATPLPGQCWVVGSTPTGDWAGQAAQVACWTTGGWRFIAPFAGLCLWHAGEGLEMRHDGASWSVGRVTAAALEIGGEQVVGARQAAISDPTGGATVDSEVRSALGQVLDALRNHGLIAT